MTSERPRRLHEHRWLWIVVVSLAALGGVFAEISWRVSAKIAGPIASQWIRSSPIVRKTAGDIKSMEVARSWSKAGLAFSREKMGRLHYVVHGSRDDLDLLVYWSRKSSDACPTVDKVQWIDARGFDTIWP